MRPQAALFLSLTLIGGCGVNPDNWSKKSAKASCKFSKRCATSNFYATYLDMDDCLTQNEAALDAEAVEKSGECVFDDNQAKECLKSLDSSCKKAGEQVETLFDPCLRVWNCGTGTGTGTGGDTG